MSRARPQPRRRARSEPVRSCVGCRERSSLTDLIRIVAVGDGTATVLVPDLRGGAPGRGAHLHPSAECLDLAERRRAFVRALRLEAPAGTDLVRRVVKDGRQQLEAQHGTAAPSGSAPSTAGTSTPGSTAAQSRVT